MKTWDFGMKYISGTLIFNITLEILSNEGSTKFTFWNILEKNNHYQDKVNGKTVANFFACCKNVKWLSSGQSNFSDTIDFQEKNG